MCKGQSLSHNTCVDKKQKKQQQQNKRKTKQKTSGKRMRFLSMRTFKVKNKMDTQ